jgi:hypothetical protein
MNYEVVVVLKDGMEVKTEMLGHVKRIYYDDIDVGLALIIGITDHWNPQAINKETSSIIIICKYDVFNEISKKNVGLITKIEDIDVDKERQFRIEISPPNLKIISKWEDTNDTTTETA